MRPAFFISASGGDNAAPHFPIAAVSDTPVPESASAPTPPAAPAAPTSTSAEGAPAVTVEPVAGEPAASSETARAAPELSPAECAARLAELFPALFAASPNTPPKPIKLRIQADIQARAPGLFTRRSLSPFLHKHTTTTSYLKALVASAHRYDLDGAPAGEVSDEHRQAAQTELDRRWSIVQARRAAERAAQRSATPDGAHPQDPSGDAPAPRDGGRPVRPPRARHGPRRPPGARDEQGASPRERPPGPARPGERPPRERVPSRPERAHTRAHDAAARHPREQPAPGPAQPPLPDDPARRERALLLRAYESTTLSRANFCALKRIDPAQLDALLERARNEARGGTSAR